MAENTTASKQVQKKGKLPPRKKQKDQRYNHNPTGKGGFGERPEDIHSGHWSSRNTVSYQYNRFMAMTTADFKNWRTRTPESQRTMAEEIAYSQVLNARNSHNEQASLACAKEITDRTEGKAPVTARVFSTENEAIAELTIDELRALAGTLDDAE